MNNRSKLILLLLFLCLMSCTSRKNTEAESSTQAPKDSTTLCVAVYPSQFCLPLYYAEAKGVCPDDIIIKHLNTMEDCDTALIHHRVQVTSTDLARLMCMRKDGFKATAVAQVPVQWKLLTASGKRITTVKQLKERLVAMARHSETDYLSDVMLKGTGLEQLDVFRTQFNDHRLRMDMLSQKLVEGALLDEPFATLAAQRGARQIWESDSLQSGWAVLAVATTLLSDSLRVKQVEKLISIYRLAVEELRTQPDTLLVGEILKKDFKLPQIEVDTLPNLYVQLKRCQPLKPVDEASVNKVKSWLIERKWIKKSLRTDSLFTLQFFDK